MKRIALSALALTMFALPTINTAQAASSGHPQASITLVAEKHVVKKRVVKKQVVVRKNLVVKKKVVRTSHWKQGQRYSDWRRHERVRDYRHYGLRRPGQGQQWIRVGNDYLLVAIASGIIGGLVAAH